MLWLDFGGPCNMMWHAVWWIPSIADRKISIRGFIMSETKYRRADMQIEVESAQAISHSRPFRGLSLYDKVNQRSDLSHEPRRVCPFFHRKVNTASMWQETVYSAANYKLGFMLIFVSNPFNNSMIMNIKGYYWYIRRGLTQTHTGYYSFIQILVALFISYLLDGPPGMLSFLRVIQKIITTILFIFPAYFWSVGMSYPSYIKMTV